MAEYPTDMTNKELKKAIQACKDASLNHLPCGDQDAAWEYELSLVKELEKRNKDENYNLLIHEIIQLKIENEMITAVLLNACKSIDFIKSKDFKITEHQVTLAPYAHKEG